MKGWQRTPEAVGLHARRILRIGPIKTIGAIFALASTALVGVFSRDPALIFVYAFLITANLSIAYVVTERRRAKVWEVAPERPGKLSHPDASSGLKRLRDDVPIIAGVASIPDRQSTLKVMVGSMIDQVDELHVYLNGYDRVPEFLAEPRIRVHRSQDHGDLSDAGKFFGLRYHNRGTYFSLDDDLLYPVDYVDRMLRELRIAGPRGIIGVHGVFYPTTANSFLDRKVLPYWKENRHFRPVSLLGTGTVAFRIEIGIDQAVFKSPRMADVWLAVHSKHERIPMWAVSRPDSWVQDVDAAATQESSIWLEARQNHDRLTQEIVSARPWGLTDLCERLQAQGVNQARLPSKWVAFYQAYSETVRRAETGSPPKTQSAGNVGDFIAFYCDPPMAFQFALSALRSDGPSSLKFRHSALASVAYDPGAAGALLERALHEALGDSDYTTIYRLAHRACHGYRMAGDYTSARRIIDVFGDQGADDCSLREEAINLHIDCHEFDAAWAKILESWSELPNTAHQWSRLTWVLANVTSAEDALPYLIQAFRQESATGPRRRLIANLRSLPDVHLGSSKLQHLFELLESSYKPPRRDPSPLVSLHMAIGTHSVAKAFLSGLDLNDSGLSEIEQALLFAGASPDFAVSLSHLNQVWQHNGLAPLRSALPGSSAEGFALESKPLGTLSGDSLASEVAGDLVSVVMAAHNCESTVGYAVRSILDQTWRNIQLIFVDDASSDSTLEIAHRIAQQDNRLIVLKNRETAGPYVCRNLGIAKAEGKFIANHDADDYAHPQRLEYQVSSLLANPTLVASFVGNLRFDESGRMRPESDGRIVGGGPMTLVMPRTTIDDLGYFLPVKSRGDFEHRRRLSQFYGSHRVATDLIPLVLAHDSIESNSRVFNSSKQHLGYVSQLKSQIGAWHESAKDCRENLYVPFSLSNSHDDDVELRSFLSGHRDC